MFICDIGTVQTYLGKWEEMRISVMPLSKLWEKVRERRETWCDGEEKKMNCGNTIAEIRREKIFTIVAIQYKKKKRNLKIQQG